MLNSKMKGNRVNPACRIAFQSIAGKEGREDAGSNE